MNGVAFETGVTKSEWFKHVQANKMTILADFGADFKQSPHDEVGEHPKLSRKVEAWDGQPKFVGDPLYEIVTFIDIIYIYIYH